MYISILSEGLLFIFGSSYLYKLYFLRVNGKINANVLGKGAKDRKLRNTELFLKAATFVWLILWLLCIMFYNYFSKISFSYLSGIKTSIAGLVITALGVGFFELAILFMKSSWRVGVDKETKTELVTDGIYKYTRNPAFVGFDLMFIGLFLTYPNPYTVIVMCANLAAIHLQILQEEKFLQESFDTSYKAYKKSTPRYLFF